MIVTQQMQPLLPKYCRKCGKKLVRKDGEIKVKYDGQTGQAIKTRSFSISCSNHRPHSVIDEHDYFSYDEEIDE